MPLIRIFTTSASGVCRNCRGWATTSESPSGPINTPPATSLGAIIAGETRCISNGQRYLLRPGRR
ncbi:hypothetical protein KCP77_23025 [Salmonella enterica subsp. enterica]|nr:hypothetical protein KCP77_23025 [Salmonella enterica subsp. enterica]